MRRRLHFAGAYLALVIGATSLCQIGAFAADSDTELRVELSTTAAGPRSVETLTEQSILRDYKRAWQTAADAFRYGDSALLNAYFMGQARNNLGGAVADQEKLDLHSRYLNQQHKVESVFYAPEGDVMELHDTAEFDLQISDGNKVIHNQHTVAHYVILMTPAADRWIVRELQEVPNF